MEPTGKGNYKLQRHGFTEPKRLGLKWNQALETGGLLVSDEIDLHVEVQVVQGK